MVRRPLEVFCFICDSAPCSCGKSAKKVAQPPAPPVIPTATPAPVQSKRVSLSGMKVATPAPKPQAKILNTDRTAADEQLSKAVTILVEAGLISDESIREHRKLIQLTDAEIKGIQWRERRRTREQHSG